MKKLLLSILILTIGGVKLFAQGTASIETSNSEFYLKSSEISAVINRNELRENRTTNLNDTAYGYIAYDPSGGPSGPVKFSLSNPGSFKLLADQSSLNFLSGGTWGPNNTWLASVFSDNTLITIDTLSGARTLIGDIGISMAGISYDYSTNQLFGVSWDGTNASLYSINGATASPTLIGVCGTEVLINLACDAFGNLYTVELNNDILYKINKTNGTLTSIGYIGFDANYAQDMEFDIKTGTLYMAAYNNTISSGELRSIDTLNGNSKVIGAFQGGAEIAGFSVPFNSLVSGSQKYSDKNSNFSVYPNPGNGIFNITSDIQISIIEIYNVLGEKVYFKNEHTINPQIDLSNCAKGIYIYKIRSENNLWLNGKLIID